MTYREWVTGLVKDRPTRCHACRGKLRYAGKGKYICMQCKEAVFDAYGNLISYLEVHSDQDFGQIAEANGIDEEVLDGFLEENALEVMEEEGYFQRCKKCGCCIRRGSICADCGKVGLKDVRAIYDEEAAEFARQQAEDIERKHRAALISRMVNRRQHKRH